MYNDNNLFYWNTSDYNYNKQGLMEYTDDVLFHNDTIQFKQYYTYNSDKLTKIEYHYTLNEKNSHLLITYFYDKKGRIRKSNYLYSEKYVDSNENFRYLNTDYYFDKKERLIRSDWRKSDDSYKNSLITILCRCVP